MGKDRGRTDALEPRDLDGADRGKKAGIGGMRDTPDGLYMRHESWSGLTEVLISLPKRWFTETTFRGA